MYDYPIPDPPRVLNRSSHPESLIEITTGYGHHGFPKGLHQPSFSDQPNCNSNANQYTLNRHPNHQNNETPTQSIINPPLIVQTGTNRSYSVPISTNPLKKQQIKCDPCTLFGQEKGLKALMDWIKQRTKNQGKLVCLLVGQAGTGKTTSARYYLQKAGYAVQEINASDERTRAVIYDYVRETVTRKTLTGQRNAIILDEIDGAELDTHGSATQTNSNSSSDVLDSNSGIEGVLDFLKTLTPKSQQKSNVCGPIICIANQKYSPTMKKLAEVAQVIPFYKLSLDALAKILQHHAQLCKWTISAQTSTTLIQSCMGDARRLLNAAELYFKNPTGSNGLEHTQRQDLFEDFFQVTKLLLYCDSFSALQMDTCAASLDDIYIHMVFENVYKACENSVDWNSVMEVSEYLSASELFMHFSHHQHTHASDLTELGILLLMKFIRMHRTLIHRMDLKTLQYDKTVSKKIEFPRHLRNQQLSSALAPDKHLYRNALPSEELSENPYTLNRFKI